MPLDALVERFAPPSSDVALAAAAYVPTLRTSAAVEVVVRATFQSAGNVAAAEVPVPWKFCVYAVPVGIGIAAIADYQDANAAVAASMNRRKFIPIAFLRGVADEWPRIAAPRPSVKGYSDYMGT